MRWITLLLVSLVGCAGCVGCATSSKPPIHIQGTQSAAPSALPAPMRPLRFDTASMQFPANMSEPKQEGTYLASEGTAEQIDASIANGKSIVVGVNMYASPASDFGKRPNAREWADHPMPPNSAFRRGTISPPRIEAVNVPGAKEAAIAVSLHDGAEPFGTGGQRALSIRLFVKDPKNDGSGWVIGAYACGDATDPQIAMDSTLARGLEAIVRTFRLN
jgi:hypothetical protein